MTCSKPPNQELVANTPLAITGTVQGTDTPVGAELDQLPSQGN